MNFNIVCDRVSEETLQYVLNIVLKWKEEYEVYVLTCFSFGDRNVSPKTCSHITSTVLVRWPDGLEESVKRWSP